MSDFSAFLETLPRVSDDEFNDKNQNQAVINTRGQITRLEIYNTADMDFTDIGKLSNLKELYLNDNQLSQLPAEIGKLSNLEWLDLGGNNLSQLPAEIGKLRNLEVLNLDDNQLSQLPADIGKLSNLGWLYLNDNQLSQLPAECAQLTSLHHFWIDDNPIAAHLEEITGSLDGIELLRYLLKVQGGQGKPLNEAKLLVVGDERVGKTSLINRLQGKPLNRNETSTQGINIISHQFDHSEINVNIWDFAGQEITHQTHQFFLSARSLYLLVLDAQKQDNDAAILHWLKVIKANGDNPPVIVAINKRDQNTSFTFDRHRYATDFNIVDVLYLSAEDPDNIDPATARQIPHNIDDLATSLLQAIEQLPDVRLPMQPSWLAVKSALEKMKQASKDYIEHSQYANLCDKHGVENNDDRHLLLRIFNQIGTIVTFDQAHLCNRQIINPEWVTEGVYKVIRKPGKIQKTKQDDIDAILTEAEFKLLFADNPRYQQPYHYGWLISLLHQFQLAFDLDDKRVLIPLRLDPVQPPLDWASYHGGLNFRFSYPDLLKKSVIARFIVKLHHNIASQPLPPYWQRGVFLSHGSANAVVVSSEEDKTITIGIDNNNRDGGELLSIIRHAIRSINGKSNAVNAINEASEQVPLLYENQLVGFADYQALLEAEDEGDEEIRLNISHALHPNKKTHKFQLKDLLHNYRINENPSFDLRQLTEHLRDIALIEAETAHSLANFNEDQINDQFRKALTHKGYRVADQSRGGISSGGKGLGERDLVIRNPDTGVAESILEGMILKSCNKNDKNTIKQHYHKLNYRYDSGGNPRNFMLVYAKAVNFTQLWQQYSEQINQLEDLSHELSNKSRLKVGRSMADFTEVWHIFVDFYLPPVSSL